MKIFLLCIILCCCIFVGLKIKEHFARRQKFYYNFCAFCETIQTKISFDNAKINLIIIDEINLTTNKDFKVFLTSFLNYVTNEISETDLKDMFLENFLFLKNAEQQEYLAFITTFGSFSKDEELNNISNYLLRFKKRLEEIKSKNEKYSNLYLKLFIIFGLMFFIVFI